MDNVLANRINVAVMLSLLAMVSLSVAMLGCGKDESANNAAPANQPAAPTTSTAPADDDLAAETQPGDEAELAALPGSFTLNKAQFEADLAELTKHPHRLAGAGRETDRSFGPGSLAAAAYVQKRLAEIGLPAGDVYQQEFDLYQPVCTEAELIVDGKKVQPAQGRAIYQMRHNFLQAPITPREGLTGSCVYVGRGSLAEFGWVFPQDKIVVMEYEGSGRNWLKAFAFGAQAVVFVGPRDAMSATAWHHVNIPANLPRFFMPYDVADALGLREGGASKTVTLLAASEWQRLRGRNVIAVIPGTAPRYGDAASLPQAMVLAANLDSLSEVPELSAGARDAANVAALLQVASYLKDNPPRRNMLLCFFDGESVMHAGSTAFYGAINREKKGVTNGQILETKLEFLLSERAFAEGVLGYLKDGDIFPERKDSIWRRTFELSRSEAKAIGGEVLDELRPRRIRSDELRRALEKLPKDDPSVEAQRDKLTADKAVMDAAIDDLAAKDRGWNQLLKGLDEQQKAAPGERKITDEMQPFYAELMTTVAQLYRQRLVEIDDSIADAKTALVLRDRFGPAVDAKSRDERAKSLKKVGVTLDPPAGPLDGMQIMLHVSVNFGDARSRWTFIHGDDSGVIGEDKPGIYSSINKTLQKVGNELGIGEGKLLAAFDDQGVRNDYTDTRLLAPGRFVDSGASARLYAIFNLSTMTVLDPLDRQGHPGDTVAALNTQALLTQAGEAAIFFRRLADDEGLNILPSNAPTAAYFDTKWNDTRLILEGASVRRSGGGEAMSSRPVRGAIVALMLRGTNMWNGWPIEKSPPGFDVPLLGRTNVTGIFEIGPFPGIVNNPWVLGNAPAVCAMFDEYAPAIPLPAGVDPSLLKGPTRRGLMTSVTTDDKKNATGVTSAETISYMVFKTRPVTLVGYGYDRSNLTTQVMRAQSTAALRPDQSLIVETENLLTIFAPYENKGIKLFNKGGMVALGNSSGKPEGDGISIENPYARLCVVEQTSRDAATLNSYRLNLLAENRITQDDLQNLQERSLESRRQADGMRSQLESGVRAYDISTPYVPRSDDPMGVMEEMTGLIAAEAKAVGTDGGEAVMRRGGTGHYFGDMEASASLSRRVYVPLVGVMNDLVTAVVLLLLLALPFAFALERLIIGTPHIYRQIMWFGVFFLLTFGVLFLVNPAFKIAATPIIIFLAFTIILLSVLVIFIMVRKLQTEVRKMQGLSSTVHSTDVSRLSTMMAAVSMGISTMRRRPLRTLLTSVTVVLLTFTILTFASFGSSWGLRKKYVGPLVGSTPRFLIRHQLWMPLKDEVIETLEGHLAEEVTAVPRYWVSPTPQDVVDSATNQSSLDILLADHAAGKKTIMSAAVGIDARDFELLRPPSSADGPGVSDLEAFFDGDVSLLASDGLFMSRANAKALGLTDADRGQARVLFKGRSFLFAGYLGDAFGTYNILEGSGPLPVDYTTSAGPGDAMNQMTTRQNSNTTQSQSELPDQPNAQFVPYSVDKVVVIGAQAARDLGGLIRTATFYPNDPSRLTELAERAAEIAELPMYAGDANGVYRMMFGSLAAASGVRDLLIPVLLGGLIVFATMLGSVSDREREIYTFSSLGLAPPHVASLFFAEAAMYAVIGGMGGYLLGQIVARLMGVLSGYFGFNVPTMNYSSTNAIVTVLIVMGTVLVSTIYPAVKASRSANPGIQRSWKIPKPEANTYDLVFPFTVSAYDITGVVSFLKEHFDNYSDTSLGVFTTAHSAIFRQSDNDMLGFKARVALAPFDLGVNQNFALLSQPSDIEGINEVRILIGRLSGAHGDWRRANRVFINDLRKQLLIWRSLTPEIMERYRQMTLEQWDRLPVETMTPDNIGGAL